VKRRTKWLTVLAGAAAGLLIAWLDLGVIGRRLPTIRALDWRPRGTQIGIEVTLGQRLESRLIMHILTASGKQQGHEQNAESRCRRGGPRPCGRQTSGAGRYIDCIISLNLAPPKLTSASGSPGSDAFPRD